MTPETSLKMLEVASATPSIKPSALGPAIKTDAKYKGIKLDKLEADREKLIDKLAKALDKLDKKAVPKKTPAKKAPAKKAPAKKAPAKKVSAKKVAAKKAPAKKVAAPAPATSA